MPSYSFHFALVTKILKPKSTQTPLPRCSSFIRLNLSNYCITVPNFVSTKVGRWQCLGIQPSVVTPLPLPLGAGVVGGGSPAKHSLIVCLVVAVLCMIIIQENCLSFLFFFFFWCAIPFDLVSVDQHEPHTAWPTVLPSYWMHKRPALVWTGSEEVPCWPRHSWEPKNIITHPTNIRCYFYTNFLSYFIYSGTQKDKPDEGFTI